MKWKTALPEMILIIYAFLSTQAFLTQVAQTACIHQKLIAVQLSNKTLRELTEINLKEIEI